MPDLEMVAVLHVAAHIAERGDHGALEYVFEIENIGDHPGRRSLSVGDVVLIDQDGVQTAWACEPMGWKKLTDRINVFPVH